MALFQVLTIKMRQLCSSVVLSNTDLSTVRLDDMVDEVELRRDHIRIGLGAIEW